MSWTTKPWTAEIAEVLNTPDWHNARISIVDPQLVETSWDIETNQLTASNDGVIASGVHARINWPLRSTADPGTADFDPTTIRSGRASIDAAEYSGELRNGMVILVTDGGDSTDLMRYHYRVAEALNSSWSSSRVFKITVDGEATNGA